MTDTPITDAEKRRLGTGAGPWVLCRQLEIEISRLRKESKVLQETQRIAFNKYRIQKDLIILLQNKIEQAERRLAEVVSKINSYLKCADEFPHDNSVCSEWRDHLEQALAPHQGARE